MRDSVQTVTTPFTSIERFLPPATAGTGKRRKGLGGKYAGASPGAREAARIERRIEVNAAALWIQRTGSDRKNVAAIYHPRPWRSAGRPTPRRRYSREHRRGCARCQVTTRFIRVVAWLGSQPGKWVLDPMSDIHVREPHAGCDA